MTKAEMVEAIAKKHDLSQRATADILDTAFDLLAKGLKKDGRVAYPGFGTFSVRRRKARAGRNPRTGEQIRIKASKTVGFKPAPTLKARL